MSHRLRKLPGMPSVLWTLTVTTLWMSTGKHFKSSLFYDSKLHEFLFSITNHRLAAYDNEIMDKLMQRFIDMKVDTKDIVGFQELNDKMQIELLRSVHLKSIGK